MAGTLRHHPFRPDDLDEYLAWFGDPELGRRICRPDRLWLAHVAPGSGNLCLSFRSSSDDRLVAVVQCDREAVDRVSFLVAVRPDMRRRGYGRAALRTAIDTLPDDILRVDGHIEPDNRASIALARALGFEATEDGVDAEGFRRFRLLRRPGG